MIPFIAFHSLLDLKTTFGVRMAIAGVPPPFKDKESLVRANVWRRLKNCSNLFPPWLSNTISCHSLSLSLSLSLTHRHTQQCTHTHNLINVHTRTFSSSITSFFFPRLLPTLLLFWPHSQCFIWSFWSSTLYVVTSFAFFFLGWGWGFLAGPGSVEL